MPNNVVSGCGPVVTFDDDPVLGFEEIRAYFNGIANSNRPAEVRAAALVALDELTDACAAHDDASGRVVLWIGGRPHRFASAEHKLNFCRKRLRWRTNDRRRAKELPTDIDAAVSTGSLPAVPASTPAPTGSTWPCLSSAIVEFTHDTSDAHPVIRAGRELPSVRALLLRFVERLASGEQTVAYEERGGQRLGRREVEAPLALLATYRELVGEGTVAPAEIDEAAQQRLDNNDRARLARRYQPRAQPLWRRALDHCL